MPHDSLRIEIGGAEAPDLYDDLLSLEVELDEQLTGMFRMTVALLPRPDGSWAYLDDERFTVWQRVVISAGLDGDSPQLITGYITHLRPDFGPGAEQCVLEVWGLDAGVLMDRADRLRAWAGKRDSDIASEIFRSYGLTPHVTATRVVHEEQVSTIVQRETDLQLLKRLALRNGFECWVDGDTGHFGPAGLSGSPQPVLAVHFGDETTVDRFRLEVDALAPAEVTMHQIDRITGEPLATTAEKGSEKQLGATGPDGLLKAGLDPGRVAVGQTVATGLPEMEALCQGLCDRGAWFVTGEGEVAANQYGTVLKPHATVTVKGVGEPYSGVYYVTHVTHRFTADGYRQEFKVRRNALRPSGDEQFTADAGGLLSALAGAL
ncbi:Phage protein D [Micromonospora rhizosphaerae]|uniref:Phage protein D n=1 Tax=Micromonospora rhizosphaerae TaxID=568872 RepID=A0A1C6SZL0_9ACTN|nr:contractile injection system protein, VgrG/Pvc8 family [Micromonospora rhizosphaerae]SCL34961.1 Phage protein D [Micromonospora rhizosphaerae]